MLVSRASLGRDMIWMLEPINKLLTCIREYRGLVILATNAAPEFLDPALDSRLLGKFEFGIPKTAAMRSALWRQKWPEKLPIQPSDSHLRALAQFHVTGAQIEHFLINWVSEAIQSLTETNMPLNVVRLFEMIQKSKIFTTPVKNRDGEIINYVTYGHGTQVEPMRE